MKILIFSNLKKLENKKLKKKSWFPFLEKLKL